jgi:hypothetical protein
MGRWDIMTDFGVQIDNRNQLDSGGATPPDVEARNMTGSPMRVNMSCDRLEYMADLIGELHLLARNGGLETLASLLLLAQAEASRAVSGYGRVPLAG